MRKMVAPPSKCSLTCWYPARHLVCAFSLALLGMASAGYQAGLSETRRSPAMFGMVLAFAGVLLLIADLDRGAEGFLTVSQEAMLDLQKSMQAAKP